jgi:pimeloyl-ACP methyl ester carboxylesterase
MLDVKAAERFVDVRGLRTRCVECGPAGREPPVVLLHGSSLGSSLEVWEPTLEALAKAGYRVLAYDQPGFGLTDNPQDFSVGFRRRFILDFVDAIGARMAHVVGHSQSGGMAAQLAFEQPERFASLVVLGTGSLLPPLPDRPPSQPGGEPIPPEGPTREVARQVLEENLFHLELITPEALETRHRMSQGKNFEALIRREKARSGGEAAQPWWQRLDQIPVPLLMV